MRASPTMCGNGKAPFSSARRAIDWNRQIADAGARIRLKAGGATIESVTRATPIVQVPSPDRVPREEVYEMEWHELPMGNLAPPKGPITLSIEALARPGAEVMQLKPIYLKRED